MSDQPSAPPPAQSLENYPHRATDVIRFSDMDGQRHVNNAVIATYFEAGRVAMFRQPDLEIGVPGATLVLVHTEISFHNELRWPGTVDIGTAVTRFGRSSFTVEHAVFKDAVCAATGSATMVLIDRETRRSRPLPEDLVRRLSQWRRP